VSRLARLVSPFIALALVLGIAACGSSEPSAEDFQAEADEVCVEQVRNFQEVEDRLGSSTSIQEEAKLQKELMPIREEAIAGLEEIEAPEESEKSWQRYMELREELRDLRKEQLKLLEEGDEEALEPLNEKISDRNDELDEVGQDAGLLACASVLPKDQAAEAEEVVEEVALTTDPKRVCDELVTQNYLDVGFEGKYEECAEFQREEAENFAEEVEIEKVDGVADTSASVTITETGGMYDGEESTWVLRREDGQWKVNLISTS
jgi:ketosteroid isomerase-like protein